MSLLPNACDFNRQSILISRRCYGVSFLEPFFGFP